MGVPFMLGMQAATKNDDPFQTMRKQQVSQSEKDKYRMISFIGGLKEHLPASLKGLNNIYDGTYIPLFGIL